LTPPPRSPTRVSGSSGKLTSFSSVFLAKKVKATLRQASLTLTFTKNNFQLQAANNYNYHNSKK
ncbi:hypothetical protein, partial [Ligilactobacillus salivarius]|uniref:hypothetical protein n=1 Tax=Ligilactobacillus salivarius TaxID=1624 RepID=UPI001CDBB7E9